MNDFAESLTCPHCERHFKIIFENYRKIHPDWANSRFDLFLFVARAHNTVNKRLEKPLKNTVQECLDAIQSATQYTSSTEFRKKYIEYVIRRMAAEMSGDNMVKVGNAQNMRRINESYWNSKVQKDTSNFDMTANVLEFVPENPTSQRLSIFGNPSKTAVIEGPQVSIGFKGGRLRLRTG